MWKTGEADSSTRMKVKEVRPATGQKEELGEGLEEEKMKM